MIDAAFTAKKADIVVCGPEASGTRALTVNLGRLCAPHGKTVRHLSLPLGDWWWRAGQVEGEIPIVISRRPDCQAIAAWRQGCTDTYEQAIRERYRAMRTLATIPNAYWVLYEAMIVAPQAQMANLAQHLGVPFDEELLDLGDTWWPWRDENAKYLR